MPASNQARPPSVERLLAAVRPRLSEPRETEALTAAAREVIAAERARIAAAQAQLAGPSAPADTASAIDVTPGAADGVAAAGTTPAARAAASSTGVGARALAELAGELIARLATFADPAGAGLQTVINATGVILHTNLGRAPWAAAAIEAARMAAAGYSMLEMDASSGRRGPRFRAAEEHLIALTGAEDALVAGNNAAAVALAVGLAGRGGVAVSRGELVEIGGGVRIPEIIRRAGARLVEVGTTNRTRAEDFREPVVSGQAQVVLRVHPSNFRQDGFVEAPDPRALAAIAHEHDAIVVDDLGSGALLDTAAWGLQHETTPREALESGADLVTFSADKLLGGPQAGLVVGRADLIARLRKDPLARAVRPDKVMLAALAATLGLYRAGLAAAEIPVWRMLTASVEDQRRRAETILAALPARTTRVGVRVVDLSGALGGGALPGQVIPSAGLAIVGVTTTRCLDRLREGSPSIIGHIQAETVLLNLRTVDPADDAVLTAALARVLADRSLQFRR